MNKDKIAKMVRIVSIPPIMITALITILYIFKSDYFRGIYDAVLSLVFLGVIPMLAYPLQKVIPKYKNDDRSGQRRLAFITNLIGYSASFVWANLSYANSGLLLVCTTYFFSVVILTICNIAHFKASGHACSFTGPLLIIIYSFGWHFSIPCVIIALVIVWSSLYLKRHTLEQLVGGMVVCALSFFAALLVNKL